MVPISTADGVLKYLMKWGLVMIPDMTLNTGSQYFRPTFTEQGMLTLGHIQTESPADIDQ